MEENVVSKAVFLESTATLAHEKVEWCTTLMRDLLSDYFEIADETKAIEKITMEFDRIRNLLNILENIHYQLWDDTESIEKGIAEILTMAYGAGK